MHRLPKNILIVLALAMVFYSLVAKYIFDSFPFSMDEYGYLYQSEIFAKGQRGISLERIPRELVDNGFTWGTDQTYSKYPPLWSAVLVIGNILHIPDLINPLLATLALLILVNILLQFFSRDSVLFMLILMAFNPYYFGYAASYFAQPLSLFLTTLCLYLFVKLVNNGQKTTLLLLLGTNLLLYLCRPLDAVVVTGSILFGMTCCKGWLRFFSLVILAFIVTAGIALTIYIFRHENLRQALIYFVTYTGKWQTDIYALPVAFLARYLQNFHEFFGVLIFNQFIWYGGIFLFLIALIGCFDSSLPKAIKVFAGGIILLNIFGYNVHPYWGWPQYGARYYYQTYTAIGLFAMAGYHRLSASSVLNRLSKFVGFNGMYLLIALIFLWQAVGTGNKLITYRNRFNFAKEVRLDIAARCPKESIIVLKGDSGRMRKWPPFVIWNDFKRNKWFTGQPFIVIGEEEYRSVQNRFSYLKRCDYDFQKFLDN